MPAGGFQPPAPQLSDGRAARRVRRVIQHFFDEQTSSLMYVVHDGRTAVVIDPVRNYEPASSRLSWRTCEEAAAYIDARKLSVAYVIDSHIHADHLTGLPFFKQRYGAKSVIGRGTGAIQEVFRKLYNLDDGFPTDGRQFDLLVGDGDVLQAGSLRIEALATPGHTPAHLSWRIDDAIFVGDTLFMPDYGTARCDFPGGDAGQLYDSIQRLYRFPDATRLFTGHDYRPGGRELRWESTVAEQKQSNVQLDARTTREEYIAFRKRRDAQLGTPALFWPALQVNIRAGELPEPESDGRVYLKIPVT